MWIKKTKISKLAIVLALKIFLFGGIAVLAYSGLTVVETFVIQHSTEKDINFLESSEEIISDFQNYVTENHLSMWDTDEIRTWDARNSMQDIQLTYNKVIVYDSLEYVLRYAPKNSSLYGVLSSQNQSIIQFVDGTAVIYTSPISKQRLEQRLDYVVLLCSFAIFTILLVLELNRLVRDIVKIDRGIQILESGNLTHRIELSRNDEINDLSESINRMSQELDGQNQKEEELRQKNYDMVTSVSHDIRTPMTTIIGYAELMRDADMTEEKKQNCLAKIIDHAYLIKDMTDHLFQYFISGEERMGYQLSVVTGNDFISFLLDNLAENLREKGFQVEVDNSLSQEFFMKADALQMRRVFNNLEGNIVKYADKSCLVTYGAALRGKELVIVGTNQITATAQVDSHGVGMRSCMDILAYHGGTIDSVVQGNIYYVTVKLPVYSLEDISS